MITTDYLGNELREDFYKELNRIQGSKVVVETSLIDGDNNEIGLSGEQDITITKNMCESGEIVDMIGNGQVDGVIVTHIETAESSSPTGSIITANSLTFTKAIIEQNSLLIVNETAPDSDPNTTYILQFHHDNENCCDWKTFYFSALGTIKAQLSTDGESWFGPNRSTDEWFETDIISYDINWLDNSKSIYVKFSIFSLSGQVKEFVITGTEYVPRLNRIALDGSRTVFFNVDKFSGSFNYADFSGEFCNSDHYFSKLKFDGSKNEDCIFYDPDTGGFKDWSNWKIKSYFRFEKFDGTRSQKIMFFSGDIVRVSNNRFAAVATIDAINKFKNYENITFDKQVYKPTFQLPDLWPYYYTTELTDAVCTWGKQYAFEVERCIASWFGVSENTGYGNAIDEIQVSIKVSIQDTNTGEAPFYGWEAPGYVCIDDEIIAYSSIIQIDPYWIQLNGCTRGSFNTLAAAHKDASKIYRKISYFIPIYNSLSTDKTDYNFYVIPSDIPSGGRVQIVSSDNFNIDADRKLLYMDPQFSPEIIKNTVFEIDKICIDIEPFAGSETNPALIVKDILLNYAGVGLDYLDTNSFTESSAYLLAASLCIRFSKDTTIYSAIQDIIYKSNLFLFTSYNDKIKIKFLAPKLTADIVVQNNNIFGEEYLEDVEKRFSPIIIKYFKVSNNIYGTPDYRDREVIFDNEKRPSTLMEMDGSSASEVLIINLPWATTIGNRLYEKLATLREHIPSIELSPDKVLLATPLDTVKIGSNLYEFYEQEITLSDLPNGCVLASLYKALEVNDVDKWFTLDHPVYGRLSNAIGDPGNKLW